MAPKTMPLADREKGRWDFGDIKVAVDSAVFLTHGISFHDTEEFKKVVVHSHTGKLTKRQRELIQTPIPLASSSSSSVGRTAQVFENADYVEEEVFPQREEVHTNTHVAGWQRFPKYPKRCKVEDKRAWAQKDESSRSEVRAPRSCEVQSVQPSIAS